MQFWNSVIVISALVVVSLGRDVTYEELRVLTASCYPLDTCNTTEENVNIKSRSCECDDLCAVYGDCCLDARRRSQMERIKNRNNICLKLNDHQSYFVVSTCKSNWKDSAMKRKCESKPVVEDPFTSIPVMSKRNNITYKNRYCANCNEDGKDLDFWQIGLICPDLDNSLVSSNNITYNNGLKTWGVTLPNNTFVSCHMKANPTKSRQENLRSCLPEVISSCSPSWRDDFIREKCESYMAVLLENEKYFRNVHCAICNGVKIHDLSCLYLNQRKLPGSPNFTHLFDVEQDNRIGTVSRCKEGEVWDSAFEKCRKLSCGLPFLVLKNGVCVPKS